MGIEEFKKNVIPLQDKLASIARSILKDTDEAGDAVQETYLRLWKNREELAGHPNIGGYATQTVKNVCIDKLRKKRETVSVEYISCTTDGDNPHSVTERNDSIRIIRAIIDSLPELQRNIMMMRDVEGYELCEIAEITGSAVTAVTVNLSRARKKVRERFMQLNNHKRNEN